MKKWQNRTLLQIAPKIAAIFGAPLFCAIFFLPLFAHASVDVKEATNLGLVGYWSLNEGTGTMAHDFSGNGNNGTLLGSPTWVAGKRGEALSLNTSSQYVNIPSSSVFSSSSFTASFWIKTTGLNSTTQTLMFSDLTYPTAGWFILDNGSYSPNIVLSIFPQDSAGASCTTGSVCIGRSLVNDGKWHFLAFTANGTTISAYLDGVLQSTQSEGSFTPTTGGVTLGDPNYNTVKSMDEFRIYNRALSASEITTLYKSGAAKITTANTTSGSPLAVNTEDNKLTKGLVGLWSFNTPDMSGTTALDKSGQGNNGTLVNTPTAVTGKVGRALSFSSASSQYVNAGSTTGSLDITSNITISAWVKPSSLPTSSGTYDTIVEKGYDGTSEQYVLRFSDDANSGNQPALFFGGVEGGIGVNSYYVYGSNITTGNWYHIVGVFNGSQWLLYVNGVQKASLNSSTAPVHTAYPMLIGASDISGSISRYFNGTIDEVRVYNRALSLSEVQQLYQTGLVIINAPETNRSLSGLVGYWTFDGKNTHWNSDTVDDSSVNGNTGTLVNLSTSTSPVAGRVGQAMSFNGSSQYVNVSSVPSATNPLTISAWVYPTSLSQAAFSGSTSGGTIIDEDENGGSAGWILGIKNNNQIWFWPSGGNDRFSTGTIPLNKWTFISATYDGTNLKLYINGVLDSTQAMPAPQGSATFFRIGAKSWITGYWAGNLDEVRLYNIALSAAQVKQLYLAGSI